MISNIGIEYSDLIMEVNTNVNLSSVILSNENKHKIEEFLNEHKYRNEFIKYNLKPINKLLFYGSSGCGKTYLAKALANCLNYKMLYVDIARSISEGNAAINISNIFKAANKIKNCIVFLDECDSIAWSRDTSLADRGDIRRATNSLFQQLDQMHIDNVFIAATNMLHRLDSAFERRFDLKLEFKKPDFDLTDLIKRFKHKDFKLIDDVDKDYKKIVQNRSKLSFAEIEAIVHRAMKKAIINGKAEIRTSSIYKDFAIAQGIKIYFKVNE